MIESPQLVVPVTCTLCNKQIQAPSRIYQADGKTPTHEMMMFGQKGSAHIAKQHHDTVTENMAWIQMLDSYLAMRAFDLTAAPELHRETDKMRHALHRLTRAVRVTDAKLAAKVLSLGLLDKAQAAAVLEMFTELRDVYEERGLHLAPVVSLDIPA